MPRHPTYDQKHYVDGFSIRPSACLPAHCSSVRPPSVRPSVRPIKLITLAVVAGMLTSRPTGASV